MGGQARPLPITGAIARLALRATKALGLSVAGVDMLVGKNGPLVIEVNASPGLEGIEKTTGANVAGRIIDEVERLALGAPVRGRKRA
jgi:ribosomal protein S6--L-glutamate ligase